MVCFCEWRFGRELHICCRSARPMQDRQFFPEAVEESDNQKELWFIHTCIPHHLFISRYKLLIPITKWGHLGQVTNTDKVTNQLEKWFVVSLILTVQQVTLQWCTLLLPMTQCPELPSQPQQQVPLIITPMKKKN